MYKCTIAIPTYNRDHCIAEAVESALIQDMQDMEILVIDDQSTDRTMEIVNSYSDPRLRIIQNDHNVGLFENFNRCLELANSQYIKILCDDDKLMPGCIQREIRIMDSNKNVVLLFSRGQRVDIFGKTVGPVGDHFKQGIYSGFDSIYAVLWFKANYGINPITLPSGVLLRKEAVSKTGWFDTNMKMEGDIDFWLRILEHGDMAVLETYSCQIKYHPQQVSHRIIGDIEIIREAFKIAEKFSYILNGHGSYNKIKQQLFAYPLGIAYRLWRLGFFKESREHVNFVRDSGISFVSASIAVLRLLSLRMLMKIAGMRLVPMKLIKTIENV